MKRRINIDRVDLRIRGEVADPRALARAVSEAIAARVAAEAPSSSSPGTGAEAAAPRHVEVIDAGRFSPREAAAGAASAVAAALNKRGAPADPTPPRGEGGA
ncbi:MAG: hypothetical protein KC486_28360 [Myxococcales bacterium]|nr:hypothetical protein [Myxococcales bacterium]